MLPVQEVCGGEGLVVDNGSARFEGAICSKHIRTLSFLEGHVVSSDLLRLKVVCDASWLPFWGGVPIRNS